MSWILYCIWNSSNDTTVPVVPGIHAMAKSASKCELRLFTAQIFGAWVGTQLPAVWRSGLPPSSGNGIQECGRRHNKSSVTLCLLSLTDLASCFPRFLIAINSHVVLPFCTVLLPFKVACASSTPFVMCSSLCWFADSEGSFCHVNAWRLVK